MSWTSDQVIEAKRQVGKAAAGLVKSGMTVGLGSGSTSAEFIHALGRRLRAGELEDIRCTATSFQARLLARKLDIPIESLDAFGSLDLVVDGADEVDPQLNLIKGGGGAHTIEKVVASMASRFVVIVDSRKLVEELGTTFPVPVEVIPLAYQAVSRGIEKLGGRPRIRMGVKKAGPVVTDLGNFIVDVAFDSISNPSRLEQQLNCLPGVLENGLFVGLTSLVLVAEVAGEGFRIREIQA